MPRIQRAPGADIYRYRQDLKQYLVRTKTTATALARDVGVNQSTVQRFLAGDTKNVTRRMREVLRYAGIDVEIRIAEAPQAAADHPRIRKALERVWDGRPQSADVLASLIEAIGPFVQQSFPTGPGASTGERT